MLDKIQRTRLSQFFKDRVGILYSGDLNAYPVIPFLICLCLCAVLLDTALHFVYRVVHVLLRRSLSLNLIGNAHAPFQIKTEINVPCRSHPLRVQPVDRRHADQNHDSSHKDQAYYASALFHDCTFLSFFLPVQASARAAFIMIAHSTRLRSISQLTSYVSLML